MKMILREDVYVCVSLFFLQIFLCNQSASVRYLSALKFNDGIHIFARQFLLGTLRIIIIYLLATVTNRTDIKNHRVLLKLSIFTYHIEYLYG